MVDALEDVQEDVAAVTHIACDTCKGDDPTNCSSGVSVFRKTWAELILEAPADLKRECASLHYDAKRPGNHPEEYWSAYYSFESVVRRES